MTKGRRKEGSSQPEHSFRISDEALSQVITSYAIMNIESFLRRKREVKLQPRIANRIAPGRNMKIEKPDCLVFLGIPGSGKSHWASLYLPARETQLMQQGYTREEVAQILCYIPFEDVQNTLNWLRQNDSVNTLTRSASRYEEDTEIWYRLIVKALQLGYEVVAEAPGVLGRGDAAVEKLARQQSHLIWLNPDAQIVFNAELERAAFEAANATTTPEKIKILRVLGRPIPEEIDAKKMYVGGRRATDFRNFHRLWREHSYLFLQALLIEVGLEDLAHVHQFREKFFEVSRDPLITNVDRYMSRHKKEYETLHARLKYEIGPRFSQPDEFARADVRNHFHEVVFLLLYFRHMQAHQNRVAVVRNKQHNILPDYTALRRFNLLSEERFIDLIDEFR